MDGNVTVPVEWSTINYKDGLALTGNAPVARRIPMMPASICRHRELLPSGLEDGRQGDPDGWGLGETQLGAYAEKARVKANGWCRSRRHIAYDAMAIGTAGYTAMLAVMALERAGIARQRTGVVTGAAGGVGSVAIAVLASSATRLSLRRAAGRGRLPQGLGAAKSSRGTPRRPGAPARQGACAGGIDFVGSTTLANVLSMARYGGAVAACGLAGGMDLPATVAPFICVRSPYLGIDSVMCPAGAARGVAAAVIRPRSLENCGYGKRNRS